MTAGNEAFVRNEVCRGNWDGMTRVLVNGVDPREKAKRAEKGKVAEKEASIATTTQLREEVGKVENAIWQLLEKYRELEKLIPSVECYYNIDRSILGAGNFAMSRLSKMREICDKAVCCVGVVECRRIGASTGEKEQLPRQVSLRRRRNRERRRRRRMRVSCCKCNRGKFRERILLR